MMAGEFIPPKPERSERRRRMADWGVRRIYLQVIDIT
jgi:hypothetical protein